MRCAGLAKDIVVEIQTDASVLSLKEGFLEQYNKSNEAAVGNLRFFYGGKEMRNDNLVGEYGVQDDTVITVFIVKIPE